MRFLEPFYYFSLSFSHLCLENSIKLYKPFTILFLSSLCYLHLICTNSTTKKSIIFETSQMTAIIFMPWMFPCHHPRYSQQASRLNWSQLLLSEELVVLSFERIQNILENRSFLLEHSKLFFKGDFSQFSPSFGDTSRLFHGNWPANKRRWCSTF